MNIETVISAFEERVGEIDEYVNLLEGIGQLDHPKLGEFRVTSTHQNILRATLYLQLYNLVEMTITGCLESIAHAACNSDDWRADNFSTEVRQSWIKSILKSGEGNRLKAVEHLIESIVARKPIAPWDMATGTGNWDDEEIRHAALRLGLQLEIDVTLQRKLKRHYHNGRGQIAAIKDLRNKLAHGALSFRACGENTDPQTLKELKETTVEFLRAVLGGFHEFVYRRRFLKPDFHIEGVVGNDIGG